jgi:hypothetical protein
MSENFEYEPQHDDENSAQVYPFPQRGDADDDGLDIPNWVNAGPPAGDAVSLAEAATRVVAGVIVADQDATPATWKAWRVTKRGWRWLNGAIRFVLAHRATRFGAR